MHSYLGGNALGGERTSCLVAGLGAADQGRAGDAVLVVGERCGIPAEREFHVKHGAIGWNKRLLGLSQARVWAGVCPDRWALTVLLHGRGGGWPGHRALLAPNTY